MAKKKKERIISAENVRNLIVIPNRVIDSEIYNPNIINSADGQELIGDEKNYPNLIQSRILSTIMLNLQSDINFQMRGGTYEQLSIWNNPLIDQSYKVPIKINDITKPNHYNEVREYLLKMQKTIVSVPYYEPKKGQKRVIYTGLILFSDFPEKLKKDSIINVYINKELAKQLIAIEKTVDNKPIFYSRVDYNAKIKFKARYADLLYMKLSRYKKEGFFEISYQDLRRLFLIPDTVYPSYKEFKRNVLVPIQNDLISLAEFWFDCDEAGFEIKENSKVVKFCFKILTDDNVKQNAQHLANTKGFLSMHFQFKESDFEEIQDLLNNNNPELLLKKVAFMCDYIMKNRIVITNKSAYIKEALINEFSKK